MKLFNPISGLGFLMFSIAWKTTNCGRLISWRSKAPSPRSSKPQLQAQTLDFWQNCTFILCAGEELDLKGIETAAVALKDLHAAKTNITEKYMVLAKGGDLTKMTDSEYHSALKEALSLRLRHERCRLWISLCSCLPQAVAAWLAFVEKEVIYSIMLSLLLGCLLF